MEVNSFAELESEIQTLRDALGVEHLVYHSLNSTGAQYAALTYSDSWVEHYLAEDCARIDPVVQGCFRNFHSVDWSELDWSGKPQRQLRDEAIDAGLGQQGYSIPIRGPSGQFAMFTVNDRMGDQKWHGFKQEHGQKLILVAYFLNQKALSLEGDAAHDPLGVSTLSPREVDALTLLGLGRSRAQAADELSISEHTLRVYIESARHKLGAMNTTHAVARGITSGLIVL